MSRYFFRVSQGNVAGVSGSSFDFADRDTAWAEMTKVCESMVANLCRNLHPDADWNMDLLDAAQKPVFRIRLVAERLG